MSLSSKRAPFIPILTGLLLVLALAQGLSGCKDREERREAAEDAQKIYASDKPLAPISGKSLTPPQEALKTANLKLAEVSFHKISCRVDTTAEVQADINLVTHVNSPVSGRIAEVHANLGDKVGDGSVLLTVRSPDVEQAEADLLQQDAQIRSDMQKDLLQIDSDIITGKTQLNFAKSSFDRSKQLYDEKIASKADYDNAFTQYQKSLQDLEALKRKRSATVEIANNKLRLVLGPYQQRLRLLGLSDEQVNKLMKSRQIDPVVAVRSSEAGVVCERKANIGEIIDTTKDLMTVGNFKKVWLTAEVPEKDIAKLTIGDPIVLKVDGLPGRCFPGKLDYIADSVNPDTRTLSVRAEVENPGAVLKPKMFGRMSILVGEQDGLTVPKTALQDADGTQVVYVQTSPGTFEERTVKTGVQSQDDVEILHGVKPSERVVSAGSFWLRSLAMQQGM